jgi:glycosyltransferase involved in cell wall biosynthesis
MISVIIPTYKRQHDLDRCLRAVNNQTRKPDEIIVVVRDSDDETLRLLELDYSNHSVVKVVKVTESGVIAALNAGLENAIGDLFAITDDDAAPRVDWLFKIENHFNFNPLVGGVGGRDWVHHNGGTEIGTRKVVGKVRWFGKVIGNHHLGTGKAREVDFLKGVNMCFRQSAIGKIRFQTCLKGSGAQVHNEMDISMAVKKTGWILLYDPLVEVDHYPAQRFDEDQRNSFNPVALFNSVHNETFIICYYLGLTKRLIYLAWTIGIGSNSSPGIIQWMRLLVTEGGIVANGKWYVSFNGTLEGIRTWRMLHHKMRKLKKGATI